jgi:hypothetical protein
VASFGRLEDGLRQDGWTGLIADVIRRRRRHGAVRSVGEIVRLVGQEPRP